MFVQLFSEMLQVLGGLIVIYFVYIYYKKYDDKPATDTSSMAQTALRELVERAVDEARKLPGLGESVSTTAQNTISIDEQSYEDLLATAILNKVVEKYQKEYVDDNSNVLSDKSSRASQHIKNKSDENVCEDIHDSFESMSPDECNNDIRQKRQDSLSLTIEEQIEEVTTLYTSDEDQVFNFQCARRVPFPEFGMDIIDPSQESSDDSHDETDDGSGHVDHITPVESWEENWLFQKKKISIQSDPVTMLVPNPSEDYRALIGDKDAEDTSDLSEFSAHSDDEVEDELIEAINNVIPKSSSSSISISSTDDIITNDKVDRKPAVINDNKYNEDINKEDFDSDKILSGIENTENISSNAGLIPVDESAPNISINNSTATSIFIDEINNREDNNNQFINSKLNHVELLSSNLNYLKNDKIPKTPTPSPLRNSFSENDSTSSGSCGLEKLNEKLESINGDNEKSIEIFRDHQDGIINSNLHLTSEFLEREKTYENNLQLSSPPRPGTIAEREHKKWENAPPIENNPYSQENIQKRLLERQYSRRSSDVNGNSAVLPITPCPSLQIVIGSNRPDMRRFGRDYYINESKSPTGERSNPLGTSISSRPSSSLSHHSNSTSSDFEQQENFEPIEAASKSLELKQNNDILERERKNSKNEINAKLNNRGNFDSIATIFDAKKTFGDDDKRKIRRIDLRAYGFENEFNINNENIKKKQQRIPNKLDLRSYGYDSGLRRTQSNNHIDSKVNNSYVDTKINSEGVNEKSNLSHQLYKVTTDDDYHWSQSTENLIEKNKIFEKFDGIKSAKSVPNITKSGLYLCQGHNGQSIKNDNDEEIHFNGNSKIDNSKEIINDDIIDSTNDINNYESDSLSTKTTSTDELPQKFTTEKKIKYSLESLEDSDKFIDKQLPMPSVKVLAQAFNTKSPTSTDMPISKISRSAGNVRERPTTPEIHIIGTPRQMHSLTARSISREFREGLRQITNKSNTPSVNTTIIEQSKMPAGSSKLDSNELENNYNTETIAPGKLKNNIQFWEQLQKKKLM
ncbi:hypothetical protein PV328_001554 [Microctonus aethiopoides]|uniref:Uncharacterized protein n=1 Tax=Microctonus aethiopoides TaxID=144406 RepID=A0AA39KXP2_9HYME|nr:hypothetical protein PV328_001554 [Microctonus aethiopoides]